MAYRVQQLHAGRRKYGNARSISSVLLVNNDGTETYQKWKEKEVEEKKKKKKKF